MQILRSALICLLCSSIGLDIPAYSQQVASGSGQHETTANTLEFPTQILKSGVSLTASGIAPNTLQLANSIGLTPVLEHIRLLRAKLETRSGPPTLEVLSDRQELWDEVQKASILIQRTDLDIDFTLAEIGAEVQVYDEILATFQSDRDKLVARVNAASFISNGILWALAEGYDVPTFKYARLSIQSGTLGIAAGLVPSIASMYTLKAVNGKRRTSEIDPNMLAKLFRYPTTNEIEYPPSVWQFINQVPADGASQKTRLNQLIDRWIADSNIPGFTSRSSKAQLDVITASVAQKKGLSIATLTAREVMLQQLGAEIMKMKRLLLELTMALQGDKHIEAKGPEEDFSPPSQESQGNP